MSLKFIGDRLPPALTPFECLAKGSTADVDDANSSNSSESDEDVDFKNGDIFIGSKIRLVREGIARLIVEDDKIVLYHCVDNSRTFREVPLSPMEFEVDDAPALETILKTVSPEWITVGELPHQPKDDPDDKIGIAKALFEEGILAVDNRDIL